MSYPCMSTQDMTDFAIDGDNECYRALEKAGGGERGMDYVDSQRKKMQDGPVDDE